jgi:hypothetical protein
LNTSTEAVLPADFHELVEDHNRVLSERLVHWRDDELHHLRLLLVRRNKAIVHIKVGHRLRVLHAGAAKLIVHGEGLIDPDLLVLHLLAPERVVLFERQLTERRL